MCMKEFQEDYLFLCKYDIHTSKGLAAVAGKISEDKKVYPVKRAFYIGNVQK